MPSLRGIGQRLLTAAEAAATVAVAGLASNSMATHDWSPRLGDVDATACLNEVVEAAGRVNRGDMGQLEAVLTAHVISLNAIFTELAERARMNLGEHFEAMERYLRLALQTQGQCRATVETLATIKNPPTVFARQANIAHGSQQVNNCGAPPSPVSAPARAKNHESGQNGLSEATSDAERLDGGTTSAAGTGDPAVAAVGTVDGPTDGRGESAIGAECRPRRPVAARTRALRLVTSMAPRRA